MLAALAVAVGLLLVVVASQSLRMSSGDGDGRLERLSPVTPAEVSAVKPAFSPDGTQLAYVSDGDEQGVFDLFVTDAAGRAPRRVTRAANVSGDLPTFRADGSALVFARFRTGAAGTACQTSGGRASPAATLPCSSRTPAAPGSRPTADGWPTPGTPPMDRRFAAARSMRPTDIARSPGPVSCRDGRRTAGGWPLPRAILKGGWVSCGSSPRTVPRGASSPHRRYRSTDSPGPVPTAWCSPLTRRARSICGAWGWTAGRPARSPPVSATISAPASQRAPRGLLSPIFVSRANSASSRSAPVRRAGAVAERLPRAAAALSERADAGQPGEPGRRRPACACHRSDHGRHEAARQPRGRWILLGGR